jgi:hypothetical protein
MPGRAAALAGHLQTVGAWLADTRFAPAELAALRRQLLADSAAGRFRYYTAAEQAFLAIETLSLELEDIERHKAALDALFEALGDETGYVPDQFAVRARQLLERL